jgi:hypothetical protein
VLDHRARPEQVLRFVLEAVEAQGGEGIFIGYGRWPKRLMGKVVGMLPAGYVGQIVTLDTSTGLPSAVGRQDRREARLIVRRHPAP